MISTFLSKYIFANSKLAAVWLLVRFYVGYEWIVAGYEKVVNPVWTGDSAGGALLGFIKGSLAKTGGAHPDVQGWYAYFLQHVVMPNANLWSHMVAYGELLVGIGLVLGCFTFLAAFFGFFMNLNYLLAGTVSINPVLLILSLLLMLGGKHAGRLGFDHYVLPRFKSGWKPRHL